MDIKKLELGNGLLQALQTIKQAIMLFERLVGLTDEQKAAIKGHLEAHHDEVQKKLDDL